MICTEYDPDCYGCQLRAKGIQPAPSATPSRTLNRKFVKREVKAPSWERGPTGERRADGSFMPYIRPDGSLIRTKSFADSRRRLEDQIAARRHAQHNQPKES